MFEVIDRPARTSRRHLSEFDWDSDVQSALESTLTSGKAVVMPLWKFHSTPAKGRLWIEGFKVKHRVLPDRQHVAAWIEQPNPFVVGLPA